MQRNAVHPMFSAEHPDATNPECRADGRLSGWRQKLSKGMIPMIMLAFFIFSQINAFATDGKVTDDKGQPLSGVTVQIKGRAEAKVTDAAGRYTIVTPNENSILVFSYVGYVTQEIEVRGRTTVDITLVLESEKVLNDVVVVGYGRQKKVNLVGAVSSVNVDEKITSRALPNISSGLAGMVPGLGVTQSSGMAGNNGAALLIRGLGTVNNSSPLVVVDGMPDVDINRVNINDIESVSVLKDATSASIYGSRAANGVILITTKSGRGQEKTSFVFNSTSAVELPTNAYGFMPDYARSLTLSQRRQSTGTLPSNLAFKNGTIDQWMALGMIDPLRYPNTDWWDVIMRNGSFQNYNLSASGGSDKANFFFSVGVKDEKGLQINNDYKQYNARFNFDYKLRSNMNVGAKFNGNWSNYKFSLAEGFTDSDPNNTAGFDMQYAIAGITPYDPVSGYYGGVMAYGEDAQAYNPYTVYVNTLNNRSRQEANPSMYLDWTPIKGLTARADFALNYYNDFRSNAPIPNTAFNFQQNVFGSRVYVGQNAGIANNTFTGYKTMLTGRLNYQKKISENHDLSALFVYSEEYWYDREQNSSRTDRLFPTLTEIDAALPGTQTAGGNSSTEGLQSYIGRVNYTAFGRYLFEGNFRIDGSSKFLQGKQFGFFPSAAVGWRFSEENFFKNWSQDVISNGKFRVSYGSLGNNSGVSRYEQQSTLSPSLYIYNNVITRGFVNSRMINTDLTWENSAVFNTGLDLGFFNNRLTLTLDYYDRLTTGMNRPSEFSILLSGAYTPPRRNIGNLRNRGIEGDLNWRDKIGQLSYGISANASYNKTTLEKWNEFLGRGNTFVGLPYGFVYTYEDIGIAQTWQDVYNATPQGAQPGDILRKDLNGDGRIDGNDQKAMPQFQRDRPTTYFAINGNASWKGFDVLVMFQGSAGRKDYWINAFNNTNPSVTRYAWTYDHDKLPWSVENRGGEWPRLGGSGNNQTTTSFWLDDLSFVRLKNLQLGYTINPVILRKIGVNSFRIAGSAENLATLTKFRGLDPEKGGNTNNMYPLNKAYSVSLNLGF